MSTLIGSIRGQFFALLLLFLPLFMLAQNDTVRDDQASNYNLNKPERVEWFRNSPMGLFIHFNVDAQLGIVISHSLVGASDDYVERYFNELPRTFDPSRFSPHEIAVLAKLAGMKYIVFTTKHHAGFCMWDTKTNAFNIMNTPYHKDLLAAFVEATRAEGLGVGFYFSPEDFYFLHTHHVPISRTDVQMDSATRQEYDDYTRRQCEELMTRYGKIDVLFIDGEPKEVVKSTCWRLQPDLLITRGAMRTPEQVMPGEKNTDPWLSCITMGTAWQYQPTNERYKSGTALLQLAIEARAKGGSLLLNVGPKPNGELPIEQEERLREMAGWYFVNHECMDSVRTWVISHEKNIWFTAHPPLPNEPAGADTSGALYAIITGTESWKEGERRSFFLHSVKSGPDTRISVLGQNSRIIEYKSDDVSCRFHQQGETLEISVVKAQRIYDDHRWPDPVVVKLENVSPAFTEAVEVQTLDSRPVAGGIRLNGKVFGTALPHRGCFYYRSYKGQVETLYAAGWQRTAWTDINPSGAFSLVLPVHDPALRYEYRAVVEYHQVEINGESRMTDAASRMSNTVTRPVAVSPRPLASPQTLTAPLIPLPVKVEKREGASFIISASTRILYTDGSLKKMAALLSDYQYLYTQCTLAQQGAATPGPGDILIKIDPSAVNYAEGYSLDIAHRQILLTGHDPAGVLHGIQTLRQLWQWEKEQPHRLRIPAYSIEDHPAYGWRGMHLDVGRHLFPVSFIKRYIDLLALYKFNTFHWHLTEDQGWRIEIKQYPRLQSIAAFRDATLIGHKKDSPHRLDGIRYGGYYTRGEIRDIVQYAADRQITVIPEIEMPGHALAALAAYPRLGCTGGPYHTATSWGVFDDVYCAGNDSVFTFLEKVLDEVMELFPAPYIHIGGDECPKTRWKACPLCQQRMRSLGLRDENQLQQYFIQRIAAYVRSKGRQIIGWDEVMEGGPLPGVMVMSWRGEQGGIEAARQHQPVVMATESHLYFDYYQSLNPGEPLAAGGYTPLEKVYGYRPAAGLEHYITGLQGQLWTEYLTSPEKVEYAMMPRAMALAEIAWSPASSRDYDDFLLRLREEAPLLKRLAVHYAHHFDDISFQRTTTRGAVLATLSSKLPGAVIRYTTDGRAPVSGSPMANQNEPIRIERSCRLRARLFIGDRATGQPFTTSFLIHKAVGASLTLQATISPRYNPGAGVLVNGLTGSDRYNDSQWLGCTGDSMQLVIDLGRMEKIHTIGMGVLNYHWQKMWPPRELIFSISADGDRYTAVGVQKDFLHPAVHRVNLSFTPQPARYIKVTARNAGTIPPGEYGAGGQPLLMTDEIFID